MPDCAASPAMSLRSRSGTHVQAFPRCRSGGRMPATLQRSLVLYTDRGRALDALEARLAPHERVAACAYSGQRRRQFVIGRLAAHAAIRRLGDHRADLWIRPGDGGAPQIASSTGDVEDIGIAIAHSENLGFACAWIVGRAPWRHIGVDVECVRRTDGARSRYAFSQRERRLLREAGGDVSRIGLLGWIAKEAAWKALRLSPD